MPDGIRKSIENLRKKLHALADEKGMNHPDVLVVSEMLDALQNEFNALGRIERTPDTHIRIEPRGNGFMVVVDHNGELHELFFEEQYEEALKRAKQISSSSKKPKLDMYYLEQKIEQGE